MTPAFGLAPHERFETWVRLGASRRWRWHMAEGSGLVLMGIVSLLTATAANSFLTGATLLAAGSMTLVSVWRSEQSPASGLTLLLALTAVATGLHLLRDPPETALSLIFAGYFTLRGVATILLAVAYRRHLLNQWEWFAVSGVTSLILAGLILSGLPGPYIWMFGLLLGVHLVFDGGALLAMVLTSDKLSDTAPAPALSQTLPATLPGPVCEDSIQV